MAEKLLDGPDVVAVGEEVGGEAMAKGVAMNRFRDGGEAGSVADGPLDGGLVEMVADEGSGVGAGDFRTAGEDPLPGRSNLRPEVLSVEGIGERGATAAPEQVVGVEAECEVDLLGERGAKGVGKEGTAVPFSLRVTDDDLVESEIDVLDPELERLEEAQAGAIEKGRDEERGAVELLEEAKDLVAGEDDREAPGAAGAGNLSEVPERLPEHVLVEEEKGRQGLVLGGGGDVFLDGQGREEGGDLGGSEVAGVTAAMDPEVTADPVEVGLLGPPAVVAGANFVANPIEQLPWRRRAEAARAGRGLDGHGNALPERVK